MRLPAEFRDEVRAVDNDVVAQIGVMLEGRPDDRSSVMPRRAFGRVRQLASGRWQARLTTPGGKIQSLGTYATRTAASRALAEHETDVARGAWTPKRASA